MFRTTQKTVTKQKELSSQTSEATGIVYWSGGLWISGYEGTPSQPYLYFIDSDLTEVSKQQAPFSTNYTGGELNAIFLYQQSLYCAATMTTASSIVGGLYKIYYPSDKGNLNYEFVSINTLESADDLLILPSKKTIYVSGLSSDSNYISLVAADASNPTQQSITSLTLQQGYSTYGQTALTQTKNSIYVSGTITNK
jgi:hypothetical protein